MPEHESIYPFLTGRQFVETSAKLHEVGDVSNAADRADGSMVGLGDVQNRSHGRLLPRHEAKRMRLAACSRTRPGSDYPG